MVRRQGWLVYVSFLFEQHIASPCVREYILRIPWHPGMFKMFLVRYPTTTNVVSCFPWIFTEAGHSSMSQSWVYISPHPLAPINFFLNLFIFN